MRPMIFASAVLLATPALAQPVWPEYDPPDAPVVARETGRLAAMIDPETVIRYRIEHEPDGAYMARGPGVACSENDHLRFDEDGIPQYLIAGAGWVYHPGTIQLCALSLWHRMMTGHGDDREAFLAHADKMRSMQDATGAIGHPFAWSGSGVSQPPGWVSALTQGKALSIYVRAYRLTGDLAYLDAGKRALEFMVKPIDEGGTAATLEAIHPSLSEFVFFEEFPVDPAHHVLNGGITALIGLYDWANADMPEGYGQDVAAENFSAGIKTLKHLLPYYELGGISAYDLRHVTEPETPPRVTAHYHLLHTRQLHILHMLTGEAVFQEYERRWIADFAVPG